MRLRVTCRCGRGVGGDIGPVGSGVVALRPLAKLRAEGLVDRITLPRAGRRRVWFATEYGVRVAGEWPELRGRRPPRLVSDPVAARLRVSHALTVTETGLQFLLDARRRGEVCQPLD
ncbi:hypothetical protein [Streptomyces rishiriensis]|uniref:hypothetical protein n=1 Tax=Streptomyces rishiriensis TaxID=68264 RepID=UPI0027D86D08|nr:hypothetical protein [Streptomyces rishiriensis]